MRRAGMGIAMMLTVLGAMCVAAEVQEKKITVKPSELPAAIREAIKQAFPHGKILAIEKEVQGEDPGQYDFEIQSQGKIYEVEVSPAAVVIEAKQIGEAAEVDAADTESGDDMKWTDEFHLAERTFSPTGRNRFFILEPGYTLVIESKSDKVIITALDQTKKIGDVVTRIVEEREFEDGKLVEVSRNFFAICTATSDVFYFGEEVDDYQDGKIVGHGGAWRADEKGCKAGIIMPGTVLLGARHYQEIAPNAMDRAEIIADDVTMTTPAGTFKNCIRVKETSPLEPGDICYKTYAPGIGMIQDEDLLLTTWSKDTEETINLKDLPQAVRRTIRKHLDGGKVTEIEKSKTDEGIVYEIEITEDGKQRDILISARGKYLGVEDEEDEDANEKEDANDKEDDR
ncbi:MAG: PepSY-like domain-containing protein [Sedimentisphaerales bacterium]|nr:PepSY-like domain-containing protein [Sedimentisphaerales bacterium]